MPTCKITVLKRLFHQDLVNTYKTEEAAQQLGPCPLFQDGQTFLPPNPGLCPMVFASGHGAIYELMSIQRSAAGRFQARSHATPL